MMSVILAALINGGIAGAAVTMAVCVALSIAPRRALNAATRYAVWWTTLLIVVVLPVFYLPHRPQPVSPSPLIDPAETQTVTTTAETDVSPVSSGVPLSSPWPRFPFEMNAGAWPARIFALWGIVALFMLLRLCASYAVLERRKHRARVAEELRSWPVRALISADIASPMAAGLFRPAILLPERLLAELDEDELEQIRVHETAHLVRRDDIDLLIERSIEALFALHPVVRWITRQIDLEREIACDDFVVEQTGKARPYAACLTRVVELAGGVRASLAAAAATEEGSHLARRVEMLLDKTRHTGTRLLKARFTAVVAALIALAWIAARTPALVAFAMPQDTAFEQIPESPQPPIPPTPAIAPEAPQPPATPRIPRGFAPPAPMAPFEPVTPPAPPAAFAPEAPQDPTPPPDPPERRLGVGI